MRDPSRRPRSAGRRRSGGDQGHTCLCAEFFWQFDDSERACHPIHLERLIRIFPSPTSNQCLDECAACRDFPDLAMPTCWVGLGPQGEIDQGNRTAKATQILIASCGIREAGIKPCA
jgi:hypothetical protein